MKKSQVRISESATTRSGQIAYMTCLMNDSVSHKKVTVGLANGLHLRPQAKIVQLARGFESDITFSFKDRKVDAKSMLDLMTLVAVHGAELLLEAVGSDAESAVSSIAELFESNFKDS